MEWLPTNALTILAGGSLIGFLLGLLGGGGSLLAVPMLLHMGGIASPHLAIGTSAVAVSFNALLNGLMQAHKGHVAWRPALLFSVAGVGTAMLGAKVGLATSGPTLMLFFGVLTCIVGVWTAFKKENLTPIEPCSTWACPRVIAAGGVVGVAAGFFGIGGGFLAVPALLWATGLPMPTIIGSALIGVAVLGLGTSITYAAAGNVIWPIAALLLLGGVVGGRVGAWLGQKLHRRWKSSLQYLFAGFVICIGLWMVITYGVIMIED